MKSYFAKLAARATLANTSAFPAANRKIPDPFEVANETSDFPLSRPSQAALRPENVHPISDISASPSPESLDHSTTLQPKPLTTISPAERGGDTQWGPPGSATAGRGPQTAELERPTTEPGLPTETPPTLIQPVALSSTPSTKSGSDETAELPHAETDPSVAQLAALQREQSTLLRKADAFMERVFDLRPRSMTQAELDSDDESQGILKPNAQPDHASRLQAIQPAVSGQESDQPSLVIGKLTVEIVPPAPAPVVPRQQLVVVRGTRGGRNGIPSSRRFGLGQF